MGTMQVLHHNSPNVFCICALSHNSRIDVVSKFWGPLPKTDFKTN